MAVHSETIKLATKGNCHIIDITPGVANVLAGTGLAKGIVTVFVPGATGAVTTMEYEPGLIKDTEEMFERLIAEQHEYNHNAAWQDGNGHSHLRASCIGPSLTVPFANSKMTTGTWQQIVFIDFDTKPREREIIVQVMGE